MATAAAPVADATGAENGPLSTAADSPAENGNTAVGKLEGKLSAGQQRRQRRKLQKAAKQSNRYQQVRSQGGQACLGFWSTA